jgi:hypothetical protein
METGCSATRFSLNKDGKYHDATFSVEGDMVSVLYFGPDGVTRLRAPADNAEQPEQTARNLLSQLI